MFFHYSSYKYHHLSLCQTMSSLESNWFVHIFILNTYKKKSCHEPYDEARRNATETAYASISKLGTLTWSLSLLSFVALGTSTNWVSLKALMG